MGADNNLVIPSCQGVLDCFNTRLTEYTEESRYCLQEGIDTLFVMELFSYIYKCKPAAISPNSWKFKISSLKEYLGYTDSGKKKSLTERLLSLNEYGCFANGEHFACAVRTSLNSTKTEVKVESEYFSRILADMKSTGTFTKYGKKLFGKSSYSSMVNVAICKERNKGAVEICIELCKLIERRGPLKEGEYAHISTLTLIERCPHLNKLFTFVPKEGNRIIKKSLEKAKEFLKMYTSIYDCFEGLRIELPEDISIRQDCTIKIFYNFRRFSP